MQGSVSAWRRIQISMIRIKRFQVPAWLQKSMISWSSTSFKGFQMLKINMFKSCVFLLKTLNVIDIKNSTHVDGVYLLVLAVRHEWKYLPCLKNVNGRYVRGPLAWRWWGSLSIIRAEYFFSSCFQLAGRLGATIPISPTLYSACGFESSNWALCGGYIRI